jgi:hypothetical protein
MDSKLRHLSKVLWPILVSDAGEGKVTEVKPEQLVKALLPILVTPFSITTTLIFTQAPLDLAIASSGIAPATSRVRVSLPSPEILHVHASIFPEVCASATLPVRKRPAMRHNFLLVFILGN